MSVAARCAVAQLSSALLCSAGQGRGLSSAQRASRRGPQTPRCAWRGLGTPLTPVRACRTVPCALWPLSIHEHEHEQRRTVPRTALCGRSAKPVHACAMEPIAAIYKCLFATGARGTSRLRRRRPLSACRWVVIARQGCQGDIACTRVCADSPAASTCQHNHCHCGTYMAQPRPFRRPTTRGRASSTCAYAGCPDRHKSVLSLSLPYTPRW